MSMPGLEKHGHDDGMVAMLLSMVATIHGMHGHGTITVFKIPFLRN